jgi:hypothetical protein
MLAVLAAAVGSAENPVAGWITVDGETIKPTHAVGVWDVSKGFEPGSKIVDVIMSTAPISTEGVEQALDMEDAIRANIEGDFLIVTLKADGSLHYVYAFYEDGAKNYGFRGGVANTEKISADRVKSRAYTEQEESLGDTPYSYDLDFEAAIVPEREPGEDLGKDGGSPGAAYLALLEAMRSSDLPTLLEHLEKYEAERLAQTDDEWRSYALESIKEEAPAEMKVVGGELLDGWAILRVEGVDAYDSKVEGRVKMVLDGDTWRFAEDDLSYVW